MTSVTRAYTLRNKYDKSAVTGLKSDIESYSDCDMGSAVDLRALELRLDVGIGFRHDFSK